MKAGVEVHQQLATGKLFCACPPDLAEETGRTVVTRSLRATGGENHHIDPAAAFQAARQLRYRYEVAPSSCLVELDEEPPHGVSEAALDAALTAALLLDARPVDEIEVMRKIVVDGSNTSGFQRTALVAVDGHVDVGSRRYSVPTICLEEDSARKVGEKDGELTFRIDRLGIPLVEVATGPEITNGTEAREVAEEIGTLLRATRRVRRGIGTIREDLNVSTAGGARVEIKGVQELRLLHRYAELEEARQRWLLEVRDRLRERVAEVPDEAPVDVAAVVPLSGTGILVDARRRGDAIRAIRLPGFAGLFRGVGRDAPRLGRELADHARSAGLRGLIHSDELPGYGLDEAAVGVLRTELNLKESDGFLLVTAPDASRAERALERVRARALVALHGVPEETRDPLPDGSTRYSRPLPGRNRMYPETDVPPVPVSPERIARLRAALPERPEAERARLVTAHALAPEVVRQLQRADEAGRFEELVRLGHPAGLVARLLTQDIPAAEQTTGESATPEIPAPVLADLLDAVRRGAIAKEGVQPVLIAFLSGAPSIDSAIEKAGLTAGPADDLSVLAERVVERNAAMVDARGDGAVSPLMGDLMKELRGRRDGRAVAEALRVAIARRRSGPPP